MKKLFPLCALLLAACSSGHDGGVTIKLPADYSGDSLIVSHVTIDNIFNAKRQEDLRVIFDTLVVRNGEALLKLDPAGAARYNVETNPSDMRQPEFYAAPGESLTVDVTQLSPLAYSVTGTPLMDDMTALLGTVDPIRQQYSDLLNSGAEVTEEQARDYMNRYDAALKKFVADHPDSPVVPYAILDLSGDDFKAAYDGMTPEARKSILMPYAELYNRQVEEMQSARAAEEARKAEVASGSITAPAFTLPDLKGKMVSLSDFKGKWVVLDFWGSWCGWCVKGFPALKKAYRQYGDRLVIIGIDCNESEAEWRAGVKEHDLPWLNLYNGNDRKLYTDYNIEGFPTKAIINPEGKLVDLTTGEDPSFFTRLAKFME